MMAVWALVVASMSGCEPADASDTVKRLALSDADIAVDPPGVDDVPALHDALQAHCVGDDVPTTPPPLPPAVSPVDALPARCDVEARLAALEARCGPLTPSRVEAGDLDERLGGCAPGTTCLITLAPGEHEGGQTLGCLVLQGQGRADDTIIRGTLSFTGPAVVSRVAITDEYGAVSTTADLLLSDVVLIGGYEGLGLSWDQEIDVALCRSRVSAGYAGVNQSWASRRVTIAGNSIAACYEATSANWGSSLQLVSQNLLLSDHNGASIHQSHGIVVVGNVIAATVSAVDIFAADNLGDDPYEPDVVDILVRGNSIVQGAMPSSDPGRNIIVD
jgi:hypothetical protein